MSTTAELIYHAFQQKPTDFSSAFSNIIDQKAIDRIEALKIEVAQSMFDGEEEAVDNEEQPTEPEEIANDLADMSDDELEAALADLVDSEEWTND